MKRAAVSENTKDAGIPVVNSLPSTTTRATFFDRFVEFISTGGAAALCTDAELEPFVKEWLRRKPVEEAIVQPRLAKKEQATEVLLPVADAAIILGCSDKAVYKLAHKGRIPSVRLGYSVRIPQRALMTWIAEHTSGGEDFARKGKR